MKKEHVEKTVRKRILAVVALEVAETTTSSGAIKGAEKTIRVADGVGLGIEKAVIEIAKEVKPGTRKPHVLYLKTKAGEVEPMTTRNQRSVRQQIKEIDNKKKETRTQANKAKQAAAPQPEADKATVATADVGLKNMERAEEAARKAEEAEKRVVEDANAISGFRQAAKDLTDASKKVLIKLEDNVIKSAENAKASEEAKKRAEEAVRKVEEAKNLVEKNHDISTKPLPEILDGLKRADMEKTAAAGKTEINIAVSNTFNISKTEQHCPKRGDVYSHEKPVKEVAPEVKKVEKIKPEALKDKSYYDYMRESADREYYAKRNSGNSKEYTDDELKAEMLRHPNEPVLQMMKEDRLRRAANNARRQQPGVEVVPAKDAPANPANPAQERKMTDDEILAAADAIIKRRAESKKQTGAKQETAPEPAIAAPENPAKPKTIDELKQEYLEFVKDVQTKANEMRQRILQMEQAEGKARPEKPGTKEEPETEPKPEKESPENKVLTDKAEKKKKYEAECKEKLDAAEKKGREAGKEELWKEIKRPRGIKEKIKLLFKRNNNPKNENELVSQYKTDIYRTLVLTGIGSALATLLGVGIAQYFGYFLPVPVRDLYINAYKKLIPFHK